MASNPQQTPFWREKKSKRRKSNSSSIWSESSRSDDEAGPPRPHRVDTSATDKANNSIMPQDTSEDVDLLQEDGYIGMFVRLCTWRQDWDRRGIFPINGPDSPDSRVDYIRQKDNTKIGQGAQFDVFKRSSFKDPENPQSVVMKDPKMVFEKDGRTRDKDALRGLLLEIEILSFEAIQRHRNIVNIIQVEWDHPSLDYERRAPTIYLEAADSGSLSDFCSWRKDIAFKRDVTRTVLLGICEGLQALHSCGITHGDLKPSNILIFKDPENAEKIVAKVSDFGCSVINRNASTEGAMSRLTGVSPPWDAPEAGDEIPSEYLHKTDIYSYGLIYWWYLLGATDPFGINDNATTSTIPSLTGDSATKIDGLKRLKRSQDMGQWLEQTVMTSTTNQKKLEDIQLEVPFIGQFTLCVDPANRSLERVMEILLM